jgi:hypothetical protein
MSVVRARRVEPSGEHEFEPARGLPDQLPEGEAVLWQGSPQWRRLAIEAFHVRSLALYFALMLAWRAGSVLADGGSAMQAIASLAWPLPLALTGLALISGLAWLSARTTVYTLTNRRVVMRLGIVLSITFNIPLRRIESASLHRDSGGVGDICLLIIEPQRIAYLHLWPHARPWQVKRTQPMLRSLADVKVPALLLADALRASLELGQSQQAASASASPVPAQGGTGQAQRPGHSGGRLPLAA